MDFEKSFQSELESKYLKLLNMNIASVPPKEHIDGCQAYKERRAEFQKRLVDEKNEYNKSLSTVQSNREKRLLNEKLAKERSSKRRKKFIKIASILCVFSLLIIGAFLFVNHQLNTFVFEYELLEDDTYAIQNATKGKYTKKVIIPDTYEGKPVSTIKSGVFEANLQLEEIVIPESVRIIESRAFYGCEKLTKLDLGSVEEIGEEAFANCSNLQEIVIPSNVKQIGEAAFSNCVKLEKVVFNATECQDLTSSSNLFKGCAESGLRVEIGRDVKRIPANLLTSTYKTWDHSKETIYRQMYDQYRAAAYAQGMYFGNSNVNVMSFETWVLSKHSYNAYSSLNVIEIVFAQESQCKEIGARAFYKTMIETIVFPKSLTMIEEQAVGGCENISRITFEDTQNWQAIGSENISVDFTDESGNVDILLEQYTNYKLQKAE